MGKETKMTKLNINVSLLCLHIITQNIFIANESVEKIPDL